MAESKSELIKEPYNPLDPIVVFDPTFQKRYVLKQYEDIENHNPSISDQTNSLKDDAINIPVVKVNNVLLNDSQFDSLVINYDYFLPTIHVSVKDDEGFIKTCDTPGLDNFIEVIITSEVNGYYKKISLVFYITDYKIYDEYISYDGIYKLQSLNTNVFKQIGDKKLSTYEMCEEIAKETKLGFAATEDCKDIKDEYYRLVQSTSYKDYIVEQLEIGGVDEKSIFDAWVDLFGYLVLVNVYYAMNEKIAPEQLTIHAMVGINSDVNSIPDVTPTLLQRTLTNNKVNESDYNLLFDNYENVVDNNKIYSDGALNQGYYMTSPGKDNTIVNEELQIIENSLDGMQGCENYEYKKVQFLGIEFEDTSLLFKKKINKRYFDKLRARRLKLELNNYNLGLERGTLVNIIFKEYDNTVIKTITPTEDIDDDAEGIVNPFSSGMYYIDGMEFTYKTEDHKIVQYLYLIKRDGLTNPLNTSIEPVSANE